MAERSHILFTYLVKYKHFVFTDLFYYSVKPRECPSINESSTTVKVQCQKLPIPFLNHPLSHHQHRAQAHIGKIFRTCIRQMQSAHVQNVVLWTIYYVMEHTSSLLDKLLTDFSVSLKLRGKSVLMYITQVICMCVYALCIYTFIHDTYRYISMRKT